jgi:uncharacterized membrane-anchored protein
MRAYNGMDSQVRGGDTVRGGAIRGEVVPKVPEVNPYFWGVKLLTTAMGEAVSDFLVKQYSPYLAVFASFVVFAIAIIWQFRVPVYRTWPYWSAVAMVAVFGTMVADVLHKGIGIPYQVSVAMFAVSLAIVFAVWYRVEGTLSIHSITTPRREFFYWATVICTFAMGTATGDLTAQTLHLGYFTSGVVFTLAICVPLVAWRLGANPVLTFWVAYILTRPIGASFADSFGMPKTSGGLGIGHGPVSLVTLALVVASIWYLSMTHKDAPSPTPVLGRDVAPRGAAPGAGPGAYGRRDWEPQGQRGWEPQGWEPQGPPGWEQPQGQPQGPRGREPQGQRNWEPEPRPGWQPEVAPEWQPESQPGWQPQGGQDWDPQSRPERDHYPHPGWDPRYQQDPDSPPGASRRPR